jgi:hypothetical protein
MAKKEKRAPESYSRLFENFAGSYVTVAVASLKANSKLSNKVITNVMIPGYLLDECDMFYYLGENAEEIFAAVRKDHVSTIMLGGENAPGQIEMPEDSEMQ